VPGGGIVVERGTFHACCDLSISNNSMISRSKNYDMIIMFSYDDYDDDDNLYIIVIARIGIHIGIDPYCRQPNLES
jgi:hypothetical protein